MRRPKSYAEAQPEMIELARQLRRPDLNRRPISLRKVAVALAERGYVASTGRPYAAAVASMLAVGAGDTAAFWQRSRQRSDEWDWLRCALLDTLSGQDHHARQP